MKSTTYHLVPYIVAALLLLSIAFEVQGEKVCIDRDSLRQVFPGLSVLGKAGSGQSLPYNIDGKTKRIILKLPVLAAPNDAYTNWEENLLTELKKKYKAALPAGSWFKQVVTMQNKLGKSGVKKSEFDYYPAAVDIPAVVKAVRAGLPAPMNPINDPQIQLVRYPTTCSQTDEKTYDLVIVIRSCASCPDHRARARRTFMKQNLWTGMKVGFFFIMGMPPKEKNRVVKYFGLQIKQQPGLPGSLSQAVTTQNLLKEADQHKDILIGDFPDEFYSMPFRTIMGFRWAALYCSSRSPLFLFLDPAYTIVPEKVMNYVKSIPAASRPSVYAGKKFYKMRISRVDESKVTSHPWAVSWNEIPWVFYPDFLSRVALFIGREQLIDATISMMFTRRFRLSDVYIGINFYRLGRTAKNLRNLYFYTNKHGSKSAMGAFAHTIDPHINWDTGKPK